MEKWLILDVEATEEEDFIINHRKPLHPSFPPLPQHRLHQHCPCLHCH